MSYVHQSLGEGEVLVHRAHIHWHTYVVPAFIAFVLLASSSKLPFLIYLVPFALLWLLVQLIPVWTTELGVTNRKVVAKWGLIARHTVEQRLEKVDSIEVNQSLLGRILGYGAVTIHGSGLSATPIKNIADPLALRRKVEEALELKRERLGYAESEGSS